MTWKKNAKLIARKKAAAEPASLEPTASCTSLSASSKLVASNDRLMDVKQLLADFGRDEFRISRQGYALAQRRNEALTSSTPQPHRLGLPPVCETILVDHLRTAVPGKLSPDAAVDGSLGRKVVPTDHVRQLLRDLHSVYAMLEKYLGFDSVIVQRVMYSAPAPWDIGSVLDTACLIVPDAELPTGWSDKVDQGMRGNPVDSSDADGKIAAMRGQVGDETIDLAQFDLDYLMELGTTLWDKSLTEKVEAVEFDVGKWTGMMPTDLLRELLVRDESTVEISYPSVDDSETNNAFRVQCVIDGKSAFDGGEYCKTRDQAEHYGAVHVLYSIANNRPLRRLLPPAYHPVWDAIELRDATKQPDHVRTVDKAHFLISLVNAFWSEDVIGSSKSAKLPSTGPASSIDESGADDDDGDGEDDARRQQRPMGNTRQRNPVSAFHFFKPPKRTPGIRAQRNALPAAAFHGPIVQAVRRNQVVIVAGETGSGKSTQVAQFLLESIGARRAPGQIVCTQPRRISAVSLATRVAEEWGDPKLGETVGYAVKLDRKVTRRTRLVFCTTGVLLRRLESDSSLQGITHVIVDEVHERSLDSDLLLLLLRRILPHRPDLRVILMSATIDEQQFAAYFGGCPVVTIPGRTFPVQRMYLEDVVDSIGYVPADKEYMRSIHGHGGFRGRVPDSWEQHFVSYPEDGAAKLKCFPDWVQTALQNMDPTVLNYELMEALVRHIMSSRYDDVGINSAANKDADKNKSKRDLGSILIFLPGIAEIRCLHLRLARIPNTQVMLLHSSLSPTDQAKVFDVAPAGIRKIVLSTNIAETGVTVPDVCFVIDSGKAKVTRYDPVKHLTQLRESFVTQANCRQRQGRAGRVRAGYYFALYSQYRHDREMEMYEMPEVQRMPLESTALKMKIYGFTDIDHAFSDLISPPLASRVRSAIARLQDSNALDTDTHLTSLGRFLGELPLDIDIGKLIAFGAFYGCIDTAITVAAFLSSGVQIMDSSSSSGPSCSVPLELIDRRSDLLTVVNVFVQWKRVWRQGGLRAAFEFCDKYGLIHKNLTVMNETRSQLVDLVKVDHKHCNRFNECLDMIHVALLSASFPNIIKSDPDSIRYYTSPRGDVLLHNRSIFASDHHRSAMAASLQHRFDAAQVASPAPTGESLLSLPAQIRIPPTVTTSRTLSPFFTYLTCMMQSDRIIVFDATNVHPLLFMFSVGCPAPLNVDYVVQSVTTDAGGVAKFCVPPKTAAYLRAFHEELHADLQEFLDNPRETSLPRAADALNRAGHGAVDALYSMLTKPIVRYWMFVAEGSERFVSPTAAGA